MLVRAAITINLPPELHDQRRRLEREAHAGDELHLDRGEELVQAGVELARRDQLVGARDGGGRDADFGRAAAKDAPAGGLGSGRRRDPRARRPTGKVPALLSPSEKNHPPGHRLLPTVFPGFRGLTLSLPSTS